MAPLLQARGARLTVTVLTILAPTFLTSVVRLLGPFRGGDRCRPGLHFVRLPVSNSRRT